MKPFDLLGPLPAERSTTVLEASAGTGKTFTLAGLVTRYIAEGAATLDEMLLITFGRAASTELRECVRDQIRRAVMAFDDPAAGSANAVVTHLRDCGPDEFARRQRRLRDALASFDAATIATTHQFCQIVLKSLGVAGDIDAGVTLVDDLDELVTEIVDDLYLAHFGQQTGDPAFNRATALALAREVVRNPGTRLLPLQPPPDSTAAIRRRFAEDVLAQHEHRKRRLGILGYDDLLSRLAAVLEPHDSPARHRMRSRWPIVMVDEFQDTDPVQWQIIDRAFSGQSTLILIGDPKQAIFAFRGGDIVTYLAAARTAKERNTLDINWRSDEALVDSLQVVLSGATLGDADIVVRDVGSHHEGNRLAGAPHTAPFRLRVVSRETLGLDGTDDIPIGDLRKHIVADLAADIGKLLSGGATFDQRDLAAGGIAVIVANHQEARLCRDAFAAAGIPAVYTGDTDVFESRAAEDWLSLLEAFDQPHRSGLVRAAAATLFFGKTAEELALQGDALTDNIAQTLREWADHARERGVAAVFEAARLAGMGERVLARQGGERDMTDLAHLTQLLQETAHRERFGLPALRDWLRAKRTGKGDPAERNRRLDSDAAAVQIMTVWVSKGLQFPIVYLPFAFNRYVWPAEMPRLHDAAGVRCLYVGGKGGPDFRSADTDSQEEDAGESLRLTYVALTRAQSQVVAWWAPSKDEINGGLSRLLRGRGIGDRDVPRRCKPRITDAEALGLFGIWEAAGGLVVEDSVVVDGPIISKAAAPTALSARHFHRSIDTTWRRTSYSGLVRAGAPGSAAAGSATWGTDTPGVSSEPEVTGKDDETGEMPAGTQTAAPGAGIRSPMSDLPTGTTFGSLVHAVLETADPFASDLAAELEDQVRTHMAWWPVDAGADELAAALVPMHDTPLGPLAAGLTLRQIGLHDRLRELDFEIPLAGGDLAAGPDISLSDVGGLLREHLTTDDPLAPYADRLEAPGFGGQSLRGYLSGSIDAVLRVPDGQGCRYLIVDYKTNRLGEADRPLTAADYGRQQLTQAMLHSDYPLQALLYIVVLHRFLRWRQPGYDPVRHLGGVLYLYVRGMCGADTPLIDGHPAGVFSWQPPAALVVALSDLLDEGRPTV